jgi:hypothetical protein
MTLNQLWQVTPRMSRIRYKPSLEKFRLLFARIEDRSRLIGAALSPIGPVFQPIQNRLNSSE